MAKIHTPIPWLKLNDGTSMPMLSYGTGTAWYKKQEQSQLDQACIDGVKAAIKLGYTHLDGAEIYKTERELGVAIKDGGVAREKLYVVTKVANADAGIEESLRESLKKMDLEYVDLYLIHSPFWAKTDAELQNAWAEMEALQQAGLTKSIGVSNFLPSHLETIFKTAKVIPACNQIEFHPYLQRKELIEFNKKHGIATTAYGPLTAATKASPGPIDDYLAALSKKYAVSGAEISLRWCIDQDVVAITTSGKEQRLSDYLRAATFKLTPREIKDLNELGDQKHYRGFWRHKFDEKDRS